MSISIFDIYSVGIGPSSSHTVGPMRASKGFLEKLVFHEHLVQVSRVKVELYGSLSLTGVGHGTDRAVLAGLEGHEPESVDPDIVENIINVVKKNKKIFLNKKKEIHFDYKNDLEFRSETLPLHSNGLRYRAFDESGNEIYQKIYYSIGGGFIVGHKTAYTDKLTKKEEVLPYPYSSADNLLELAKKHKKSISEMVLENEKVWRSEKEIKEGILNIWQVMQKSVKRGFERTGELGGGLKVKRRAPEIYHGLISNPEKALTDPLRILDWVNLYALAVNEENAAGGRVVTAPTNGAAGIIPAVLHYYDRFCSGSDTEGIINFLLAAGAVGILYKMNASISGAEVGCQGEVGVACSMASAGLTEALGGTPEQVENAAEIGMEHNLGLTCDPIGGLVQIPCIERNAMASVKAINASRMAIRGDGQHYVSLDKVMVTMRETGKDMQDKYKETSKGGLAVNVTEC